MRFKSWLEGEYGTSASGPLGDTAPGGSNFGSGNDEPYADRGIKSTWTQLEKPTSLKPKNNNKERIVKKLPPRWP